MTHKGRRPRGKARVDAQAWVGHSPMSVDEILKKRKRKKKKMKHPVEVVY